MPGLKKWWFGGEAGSTPPVDCAQAYYDYIHSLNPTGHWTLNDTLQTDMHDEVNDAPGTFQNTPTLQQPGILGEQSVLYGANKFSRVYDDGVVTNEDWYSVNPGGFSIVAWVNISSYVNDAGETLQYIASKGETTTREWYLRIGNAGSVRFHHTVPSSTATVSGGYSADPLPLNEWVCVIATIESNQQNATVKIYLNGVDSTIQQGGNSNASGINHEYLYFSKLWDQPDLGVNGYVDEVATYIRPLTPAEALQINTLGRCVVPPIVVTYPDTVRSLTPVYYYRLGEATGETIAVDDIGGVNDGTYQTPGVVAVPSLICDSDTSKDFASVGLSGIASGYVHTGDKASITCVINWNGPTGAVQWITCEGGGGYNSWVAIGMNTDKWYVNITYPDGSYYWWSNSVPCNVPIGVDTHITYTIDGTAVKIYVNKTLSFSQTASRTLSTAGSQMGVGSRVGGSPLNGVMDEFAYYDKGLIQTDVDALVDAWQTGCA